MYCFLISMCLWVNWKLVKICSHIIIWFIINRASFVVCPCCYGSIRPSTTSSYPKSDKLQSIISEEDYNIVAHASDQTSSDHDRDYSKQGKYCMGVIDSDRMYHAEQHGYQTELFTMQPRTCSPKNNVIYGHCLTRWCFWFCLENLFSKDFSLKLNLALMLLKISTLCVNLRAALNRFYWFISYHLLYQDNKQVASLVMSSSNRHYARVGP